MTRSVLRNLRCTSICATLLLGGAAQAEGGWQEVDRGPDYVLYASHHPSGFERLKVVASLPYAMEELCNVAWGDGSIRSDEPNVVKRQILESSANYRLSYEQVSAPVVSDRDYVVEYRREQSEAVCRLTFRARNDKGPPPSEDFVRITRMDGEIRLERKDAQNTQLVYLQYANPGGSVPAFVVKGARRDGAIEFVQRLKRWMC